MIDQKCPLKKMYGRSRMEPWRIEKTITRIKASCLSRVTVVIGGPVAEIVTVVIGGPVAEMEDMREIVGYSRGRSGGNDRRKPTIFANAIEQS